MPEHLPPTTEAARLAALQKYNILDTPPEPAFDDIARLAAFCCQTPIAAINFVDGERVWAKAQVGLPSSIIPRTVSVCTYTIMSDDLCMIEDTTLDPHVTNNPLVTGPAGLRFYAGVPLLTPEGYAIGTLCVMDVTARAISPEQQAALLALARQVTTQLELRRNAQEMQREIAERQATQEALRQSQQLLSLFVEQTLFAVISFDTDFRITDWNPAAEKIFGYSRAEVLGRHPVDLIFPEKLADLIEMTRQGILTEKQPLHGHNENLTRDGRTIICEWYGTPLVDATGKIVGIIGMVQEATEAIRAAQALQESEARFRTLFEASPLGICIIRDRKWLYANPAALTLFGANPDDQNLSHSLLDYLAPQSHLLQLERIEKRKRGEFIARAVEMIGKRVDGSYFPLRIQAFEVTLQDGPAMISFMEDITESRQAKEELEHALALLQATLESTADGIIVVDAAGKIVNFNQKLMHMWNSPDPNLVRDSEQLMAAVLEQLADPADFLARIQKIYSNLRSESFDELLFKDGRIFESYSRPVRIDGSSVARILSFRDVSEQRQAAEALRQSEALLRGIIDNTSLLIFVKSLDGRYLLINRQWERRNGITLAQIRGKTNYDLYSQDKADQYHAWDQALIAANRVMETEEHVMESDGLHTYSCLRALLYDQNDKPYAIIGISTDITERRHLEEQLQQAQKMEAVGRLAGGIAHDFNNILTTIYSACTLARRRLSDDAPVQRYLNEIQKAGERAAALIQQLLAFSRKQVVQTSVLNLRTLLLDMEEMLKRLVGEGIQVTLQLAPDLGAIQADPNQIEQVLLNLAANARDAMLKGGFLTITADNITHPPSNAYDQPPRPAQPYVRLSVADSGQGVDPAVLPHIFEPFFTTKAPDKGTGLGLATVYGIVRQNGGEIQVASQPGQGTTVRILLPMVDELPQTIFPAPTEAVPEQGTETILVVEDQESVRRTTIEMLTMNGYQVVEASSSEEALRICASQSHAIDLLLTDVVMPVMGGSELVARLRAHHSSLKVLYMSGHTEDERVIQGLHNEEALFLQKPFTLDALLQKLRTVLDESA